MRAENDNGDDAGGGRFQPSRVSLFLPVAVILVGYSLVLLTLAVAGRSDGAIARLCIVVLTLIVPFLIAHAVLRLVTMRLLVLRHTLHLHPGFPRSERYEIPYGLIESMRIRRGIGGRIAGSGTLVLTLADGQKVAACDLADPE
ncbi:MAG: PH domain-containing protein, partial [Mesorhizobium sp.]|nr:PH domain-containing protein [Mesorhizobium sp.]